MGPRTRALLRPLLLTAVAFTGGAFATNLAVARTGADSPYDMLQQMSRVLVLIENDYVEPVDRRRLVEGAIKGMVAELDPHSDYMPPEDYKIFESDTEGHFGGIGVEVDFQEDHVTVIAPIEGSPADHAGIKSGDRIVAIDNQSVHGKSPDELVRIMRGPPGTKVVVAVRREGNDKLLYFTLTREIIHVSSVADKLLAGSIAYIRIKQFQEGTHDELLEAVTRLRNKAHGDLHGTLLDLRNNPGGLVNEASAVANEFLTSGVIYTTRHRGKIVDEVRAADTGALRRGPLVVLVNEYSASAAELVAGALQDRHRGTLVGARTFGKGSVQTILDLPGGAGLRLTTMRYYTPSGRSIQAQGVLPDVKVAAARPPDKTFGIVRESDLENHLPAQGPPGAGVSGDAGALVQASANQDAGAKAEGDGGSSEDEQTHLGVAREIPDNPSGGADLALSIGYQILRGVLVKR